MRTTLICAAACLLAGCANPPPQPRTAEQVQTGTTSRTSDFDALITYNSPISVLKIDRGSRYIDTVTWHVRAWQDKKTKAIQARQLYVMVEYGEGPASWRFYNSVNFRGGRVQATQKILSRPSCHRYGCDFTEVVGVDLAPAQWAELLQAGTEVRLNSQQYAGREVIIAVPADYARAVDAAIAAR